MQTSANTCRKSQINSNIPRKPRKDCTQGLWKHFLGELKSLPSRAVVSELLHCCTVPGRVGRSAQCSCTVWNRDAGLGQSLSWAGRCWNPLHSDAQKLGKKSELHSIRTMVFVYLIPGVRGIAPPQTHPSILCTVIACIRFLLNMKFLFPNLHIATYFLITWLCKSL